MKVYNQPCSFTSDQIFVIVEQPAPEIWMMMPGKKIKSRYLVERLHQNGKNEPGQNCRSPEIHSFSIPMIPL